MSNARGSEHMLNRVMTKDNIALAALLETKPAVWEQSQLPTETESQHQQILVCTAHIHWDPEFCDVKLIQVCNILREYSCIQIEKNQRYSYTCHGQTPMISIIDNDANGSIKKTHSQWITI